MLKPLATSVQIRSQVGGDVLDEPVHGDFRNPVTQHRIDHATKRSSWRFIVTSEIDKNPGSSRFVTWMVVALIIAVVDQLTKLAIIEWIPLYDRVPLNSFINLTHQKNTGAAFSFLADK
jgi:hypothetical protein